MLSLRAGASSTSSGGRGGTGLSAALLAAATSVGAADRAALTDFFLFFDMYCRSEWGSWRFKKVVRLVAYLIGTPA
jgi:hypothetical protein